MGVRAATLELAILGELDQPLHGYELRRRLSESIGTMRRLSFGSLYPALHRLEQAGLLGVNVVQKAAGKRKLITYAITDAGRSHLTEALEHVGSDDESFSVAIGLMSKATPAARLRLLRDRRARVLARREERRGARADHDPWRIARRQMETDGLDQEIGWLDRLIAAVQGNPTVTSGGPPPSGTTETDAPPEARGVPAPRPTDKETP